MSHQVQPGQASEEVLADLRAFGIERPSVAGDPMDERLDPKTLQVILQVGFEHLAKLGGAKVGDFLSAEMVNRGLLAYLRSRGR